MQRHSARLAPLVVRNNCVCGEGEPEDEATALSHGLSSLSQLPTYLAGLCLSL